MQSVKFFLLNLNSAKNEYLFSSENCFRIKNGTADCCTNFFEDGNKCTGIVYQFKWNNRTKMNIKTKCFCTKTEQGSSGSKYACFSENISEFIIALLMYDLTILISNIINNHTLCKQSMYVIIIVLKHIRSYNLM